MRVRRLMLMVAVGAIAGCGLVVGALLAALHSPALLNRLANLWGYEVRAEAVSVSPGLSGSAAGLRVRRLGDDRLTLLASRVAASTSLPLMLRGEVESLVLQSPRLTLRIPAGQGGATDLSALERLPNVRRLDVHDAQALVTFEDGPQRVELTRANLTVRNFSSRTGGDLAFQTDFAVNTGGDRALAATGQVTGRFALTGLHPRPYGKGSLELVVHSGTYTGEGQTVPLSGLRLTADMVYERATETFAVTALRGESKGFGAIKGAGQAVLRGETPWSASLSAAAIDIAQVFTAIRPFLPEAYRGWTLQGQGAVETEVRGTYVKAGLSFAGKATFSFSQAGMASPDGSKAAQGVGGTLVLRLQYGGREEKVSFDARWEQRGGEYLWGQYYNNLAGQTASLAADGMLAWDAGVRLRLSGALDLYQTGEYRLSGEGDGDRWVLRARAAEISHPRLADLLLKDHLKALSPSLAGLSVSGASSLETVIRRDGASLEAAGRYRMTDTTVEVPDLPLVARGLAVDLPFALRYPPGGAASRVAAPGFLRFESLAAPAATLEALRIPLVTAGNGLEVPEPVTIPLFGGAVRLHEVQVDDLLFPARYRVGVKVEAVDLGLATRRLLGTEYPGTVSADLGVMTYEKGRLASGGTVRVRVFGGEVEATNLFVEDIAGARRFGGDIAFRGISLEEVTRRIAVGKMSGIVQGSLRDFSMEYGQPASVVLEVESVDTRGVEQWISVDAIQNISILGTGAGSVLNRGLTRFFRQYPYSRIGIRCVLRNDQFTVRGTIREDGTEYLVRRGLFRGVDVVNQNPDNVISFKDMQERLARIYRRPAADASGVQIR